MKIYIASAMFTEEQKERIDKHAKFLRAIGHTVYVPHEFKVPNAKDLSNEEWANEVFLEDVHQLDECDAIYYFCEGMEGDLGSAWECGYAYAKGKRIFVNELEYGTEISLMVAQSANNEISGYQS